MTESENLMRNKHQTDKNAAGQISFGSVLQKYRIRQGLSQTDLALKLGKARNTVTNWERGINYPDVPVIKRLCSMLEIPLCELFNLTEPADTLTDREKLLLTNYRGMEASGKRILEHMAEAILSEELDAHDNRLKEEFMLLPLHSTPAAAGTGCPFNDSHPEYRFIRKSRRSMHADAIVSVKGQSMEPVYFDGDLVYIRYTSAAEEGCDYVCSTADGAVIKRVRNRKLFSVNENLPFGEKYEDDHVRVLGQVIGVLNGDDLPSEHDIPILETLMQPEIAEFYREFNPDL